MWSWSWDLIRQQFCILRVDLDGGASMGGHHRGSGRGGGGGLRGGDVVDELVVDHNLGGGRQGADHLVRHLCLVTHHGLYHVLN